MKKNFIFCGISLFLLLYVQPILAQEIKQEPEPPQMPEPSPQPDPIKSPKSEPIPAPFPEETESEKIKLLTEENSKLKENSNLEIQITELNNLIKNLHEIIMEQIKVIMNLVSKLKMVMFDKYSQITNF